MDKSRIEKDMFNTMFAFMNMGKQVANYESLHDACEDLWHMMCQKTAGQDRANNKKDIPFENLERLKNTIVIEALVLYCCGELKRLMDEERNGLDAVVQQ